MHKLNNMDLSSPRFFWQPLQHNAQPNIHKGHCREYNKAPDGYLVSGLLYQTQLIMKEAAICLHSTHSVYSTPAHGFTKLFLYIAIKSHPILPPTKQPISQKRNWLTVLNVSPRNLF